jgi:hypothetical protein
MSVLLLRDSFPQEVWHRLVVMSVVKRMRAVPSPLTNNKSHFPMVFVRGRLIDNSLAHLNTSDRLANKESVTTARKLETNGISQDIGANFAGELQ